MSEIMKFPQILGTETEVPIAARMSDVKTRFVQLSLPESYRTFLIDALPVGLRGTFGYFSSSNQNFLSNGARYYNDYGDRYEYATPEDISIESVVLSELAGEWLVAEGLRRYMIKNQDIKEAFFSKRVDAFDNKTWGYHINVGESRQWLNSDDNVKLLARPLLTHLATSLPMLGGGAVSRGQSGEFSYSWGQKVLNPIWSDFGTGTTGEKDKPIINLRDEPLSDASLFRRLHIVGVDPHVSPWASKMLIGTISLMLMASRQGLMDDMVLNSEAAFVMRQAARDMDLRKKFYIADDKKSHTVLDIQERLVKRVGKTQGRTPEQDMILAEWQDALTTLKRDPSDLEKSDAILKKKLLDIDLYQRDKSGYDAVSRLRDMRYTSPMWVTSEQARKFTTDQLMAMSPAGKIRRAYFAEDMRALGSVADRVINPPKTTRAYKRGTDIYKMKKFWKNWNAYSTTKDSSYQHMVNNPLQGAIESIYTKVFDDIIEE